MFAHEINYLECSACGEEGCFETCRYGVGVAHVSSEREVEVLPPVQAAQGSESGELRERSESGGWPAPALPTMPEGVSFVKKARTRSHMAGTNLPSRAYFDPYGELGDF